jgi:ATP-dependent DNA helicase PIF1
VHSHLKEEHNVGSKNIFVCAPTGKAAACLLGGTTLHQFAGLQVDSTRDSNTGLPKQSTIGKANMKACKTLIIDECSMLSKDVLSDLDVLLQLAKGKEEHMGGVREFMCPWTKNNCHIILNTLHFVCV